MKAVSLPLVIASLILGLLYFNDVKIPSRFHLQGEGSDRPATRNAYYEDGRLLFTMHPDPSAKAGQPAGYMIHFEKPLKTFMGKTLTLQAVHPVTGTKETVSTEAITKPSDGYPGLERYTATFALPLEGMWELYVLLDDKPYGHVQLSMLEPSWDLTPEFRSGSYMMRGIEKKVGFIDAGFVANKPNKYMWHFWGSEDELNGPFQVRAVKQGTDQIIDVYSSSLLSSAHALGGKLNGADRSTVTMMMLPEAGHWRLLPYVRGHLLDTIVVEVSK